MPTKDFLKVFNHGKDPIRINRGNAGMAKEARPVELHYKEDGDIEDNPSFVIVMDTYTPQGIVKIYGQFSLNTIQKAMADLGYTLYKL